MANIPSPTLSWMAKLAIALIVILLASGLFWHGMSEDAWRRMWRDLFDRPGGPMTFRFILQPVMALIAAAKDGREDARSGRSPYFWTVLTQPAERKARLTEGIVSTARIILLGLAMDVIYQITVFRTFYPVEAVNIAIALAFIPYLLMRGPFARFFRRRVATISLPHREDL